MVSTIKDPIENVLGRRMGLALRAWKIRMDQNLSEAGIDIRLEHFIMLKTIYDNEGLSQQEITFHLFVDKTAITRWIDQLEKKNLVLRVPDKQDRRKKLIYLTNDAKKLFPKVLKVAQKTEKEAVEGINKKDVETCKIILGIIKKNLEELI